jgi:hypothetical protein
MVTTEKSGRSKNASVRVIFETPDGVTIDAIVDGGVMTFRRSPPRLSSRAQIDRRRPQRTDAVL